MLIRFKKQTLVGNRVYRPYDEADFDDLERKKELVASGAAEWYDPTTVQKFKKVETADVKQPVERRKKDKPVTT